MALWDLKEQENLQDAAPRKRGLSIRVEKNVNKDFKICKVASKRVFVPVSGDCLRESIGTSPGHEW